MQEYAERHQEAPLINYFAMRAKRNGGPWHLGSDARDTRTYCGIVLLGERERGSVALVNCHLCRKTAAWRYAQHQETEG